MNVESFALSSRMRLTLSAFVILPLALPLHPQLTNSVHSFMHANGWMVKEGLKMPGQN